MKCIILCAGYATRLYPLTENQPKALLPVRGKPLLNYTLENISKVDKIDEVLIISNDKFYGHFSEWKDGNDFGKSVKILNDGTLSNETRLGGIGNLWFTIENEKIDDDVLVILGDNFFNFNLKDFVDAFNNTGRCLVGLYDVKDLLEARNFGVVRTQGNRIISFEEKPENPVSTLVSVGLYVFPRSDLKKIKEYLDSDKPRDGPGHLVKEFSSVGEVHGFVLDGFWHDIGTIETYERVNGSK